MDLVTRGIEAQHAHHDIEIALIILDLGTLIGVKHILEHQRVQIEGMPNALDHLRLIDAVDIEPGDLAVAPVLAQVRRASQGGIAKAVLIVLDDPHWRVVKVFLANVNQRPGRGSNLPAPSYD